jgi:long-chain acyl-CoA synthetase
MMSERALGDFFRAAVDIPEIPFGEMLWETAQRFPEKIALVFQGRKISYRELDGLVNAFANALANLGVRKGDRVALYMTNRPELERSLTLVQQHGVTLYSAVPPILIALDNYPDLARFDLSGLRYIMVGAAPLAPDVAQRVQSKTGVRVLQGYGLTEASPITHLNPVDQGQIKLESVGLAVSNQEEKIVDLETGERELGIGEVGELLVKGPHVMKGYWKAPEETSRILRQGWLYTGDIAKMDAEGYVYIVDRKKDMIKYKGFSVAPAEVEAVLFTHPAVADCAVISKPDPEAGEIPKALVLLRPGEEVSADALMDFVGSRIASYKKVREVEFVSTIPKTASGKVLRRVLVEAERSKAGA